MSRAWLQWRVESGILARRLAASSAQDCGSKSRILSRGCRAATYKARAAQAPCMGQLICRLCWPSHILHFALAGLIDTYSEHHPALCLCWLLPWASRLRHVEFEAVHGGCLVSYQCSGTDILIIPHCLNKRPWEVHLMSLDRYIQKQIACYLNWEAIGDTPFTL